jgi:hypothetical protein
MSGVKAISVLLTFLFNFSLGQNFQLDTREVKDLVKKWNYANNWRSEETFRSIYHDRMIFYAQELSRERCIALKQKLFQEQPEFKQKIITDPVFTPYTSGVIKCEFQKEVFQNHTWKTYPAYLLISYENNRYVVSGESDLQTDRVLKYDLEIGDPMDIPVSEPTPAADDSLYSTDSIQTTTTSEDSTLLGDVYDEVLSEETVTIPKKYIYFLIGFLILTVLIVLFSKPRQGARSRKSGNVNGTNGQHKEPAIVRGDKGFESFVASMFDPHFFTLRLGSHQKVLAGNNRGRELSPDMEFEFHNKNTHARFMVECLYIPQISAIKVLNIFGNDIRRYQDYQRVRGVDIYVVVGVGGESDNPKEIYVIKSDELPESRINYSDLQPFRKYGMFFYNATTQKLQ